LTQISLLLGWYPPRSVACSCVKNQALTVLTTVSYFAFFPEAPLNKVLKIQKNECNNNNNNNNLKILKIGEGSARLGETACMCLFSSCFNYVIYSYIETGTCT
jgi:hypothetical protein